MELFPNEQIVGIFRGFREGGMEFHADLVLPYRNDFQSIPMHGQFLLPDQWLRSWFLGGPPEVDYSAEGQVLHSNPEAFASDLRQVWRNVGKISAPGAHLVIRFGGINDRKADPLSIVRMSLESSGFELQRVTPAGSASNGKRQAIHFSPTNGEAREEHDIWAVRAG